MKRKITLVPVETQEKLLICSFRIDDDTNSEMVNFYEKLEAAGKGGDLAKFVNLLDLIGKNGAQERYLRYAGKRKDNVFELPDHYLFKSKFRLYCLRYGEALLLIGNGGLKTTKTYQEDPVLDGYVSDLQQIDVKVKNLMKRGELFFDGADIHGTKTFYIE